MGVAGHLASEPIEQTSSFFSPSPNGLARNLILNHTLGLSISLEIGLVMVSVFYI